MRIIPCDARYVRHVHAALAVVLNDIRDDVRRRAQGRKPKIADEQVDPTATGQALIVVGVGEQELCSALDTLKAARTPRTQSPL